MTPRSLLIENFGPFKGKPASFKFPTGPGLFFLWGDNRAEPRLEGNGAGKSSVWNALCWCLYGKTTRGIKAGDAANWDVAKGSSVQLEFADERLTGGAPAFIRRTWSPNTWTYQDLFGARVDLAADETNPVAESLRLSFSAFLNSILMAQGQPMFLDLKPEAKAALFSDVMGLDKWVERSKAASALAATWDDELRASEVRLARAEGLLQTLSDDPVGRAIDRADEWEAERGRRRLELRAAYELTLRDERTIELRLDEAQKIRSLADSEAEAAAKPVVVAEAALQVAEKALVAARKERDEARGAFSEMERRVTFLEENDECPTCGAPIDGPDHGHLQELNAVSADLRGLDERTAALDEAVTAKRAEAMQARQALQRARAALVDSAASVRDAQRALTALGASLDDMEARDEAVAAERNPWAQMIAEHAQRLTEAEAGRDEALRRAEHADSRKSLFTHWVKWHKEIRLQMISDALMQLEIEVNAEAGALGLMGWELRFDVDREGKGGGVQRGFLTTVLSPHNDRAVPWEAWSGGESQRLRAAAQMGLSNLIRRRTGATMPLEVWDEPTQWLSPRGVEDLLAALGDRARRERLQIWVVDHRSLGHGGFDGQVGAIKEPSTGTRFLSGSYSSGHGELQRTSQRAVADGKRARARLTT
jgi:DNA repair exonuclease SbcCD ATPase subunit